MKKQYRRTCCNTCGCGCQSVQIPSQVIPFAECMGSTLFHCKVASIFIQGNAPSTVLHDCIKRLKHARGRIGIWVRSIRRPAHVSVRAHFVKSENFMFPHVINNSKCSRTDSFHSLGSARPTRTSADSSRCAHAVARYPVHGSSIERLPRPSFPTESPRAAEGGFKNVYFCGKNDLPTPSCSAESHKDLGGRTSVNPTQLRPTPNIECG